MKTENSTTGVGSAGEQNEQLRPLAVTGWPNAENVEFLNSICEKYKPSEIHRIKIGGVNSIELARVVFYVEKETADLKIMISEMIEKTKVMPNQLRLSILDRFNDDVNDAIDLFCFDDLKRLDKFIGLLE